MTKISITEPGLVLVGYRATGKSTVGRIVAERLRRPFVDIDREIESRTGRSIRVIFESQGEAAFREQEAEVLAQVIASRPGVVVATGGGAILLEGNRRAIRDFGFVAWLTADAAILSRRLETSRRGVEARPALTSAGTLAEIAAVLEARTPLYREVAHASVDTTDRSAPQVADAVLEAWSRHRSTFCSGAL
jgi:shikimate kinase